MNEIKDGGSAFPSTQYANGISPTGHSVGMTLRDYFAAKAMQVVLKDQYENDMFIGEGYGPDGMYEDICAEVAYTMADAMLKARER
jgi:hypothetical protein